MLRLRQLLLVIASLVILSNVALAQNGKPAAERRASASAVTAKVAAGGVRFVSTEGAAQIRLEIFSNAGERLFDSNYRQGGILDWKAEDVAQGLADGSYLCVVSVKDLQGGVTKRTGAVSLRAGQVSMQGLSREQLESEHAQAFASSRQAQSSDAGDAAAGDDIALTVLHEGAAKAVTVTTHDGHDGQVTSASGALTFRTGDVFSGKETEQMRVTTDGRIGIGTDKPEATLDVAGTIRARGGIVFDDGSVLKSAADAKDSRGGVTAAVVGGVGGMTTNAVGTGTVNQLPKWTDNVGTLGDSAMSEVGGNVAIGSTPLTYKLNVGSNVNGPDGIVTRNAGNTSAISQLRLEMKEPTGDVLAGFDIYSKQHSIADRRGEAIFWTYNTSAFTIAAQDANTYFRIITGGTNFTANERFRITPAGNVGIGTPTPSQKLEVAGSLKLSGVGSAIFFPDGTSMTTAASGGGAGGGSMSGSSIINAINDPSTAGAINDTRLSGNVARLNGANAWSGSQVFSLGLSANGATVSNVGNPSAAGDATNKAYVDSNFVKFVPGAEQLSVGDANGTAPMINLRGGSTCCSGPGGHTPAWFKVFQNGSFVATGNLGIGVSPMEGKGYRTSWHTYKGAFRSGYADNEWDDANTGFFSWAGGSNSTASGLYAFSFGDTNFASSTSSIAFGSGNETKGAAGFSAGAGNRVCDTYGVAFGNKAQSGGPLINGKCDPDAFNIKGLAAVAMGYNVTADKDHSMAFGKFASNNGFSGTFIWSDGAALASADTFRNTANNEFAARATGGFRFRTNLTGTTGCNLPAGSGVFNCTSSRTTKENFFNVKGEDVLTGLRKVPVSTWNYISEGGQSRHMGPMAEDFYAAFSLGTSNKAIGVQDLAGVSLAAIKALDARTVELQQKSQELERLRAEVNALRSANAAMESRLAKIEQALQAGAQGEQK